MRPLRPLANDLSWMVLASALPAAWVAASLATYLRAPSGTSVLLLLAGLMALIAGAAVTILTGLDLTRSLGDLAADAALASRERPLARLRPALRELAAIADGIAATAARLGEARARPAEAPSPNAEAAPTLAANDAAAWQRPPATEHTADRAPAAIASIFSGSGSDEPRLVAAPDAAGEVNALLQLLAARMRTRAQAAGIDFGAAILPELGTVQGPAQTLAEALDLLGDSALTSTPRGGRVLLRADCLASGSVRIAFACDSQTATDGLEMAGRLVELNGGFSTAKRVEEARALVAVGGGQLAVEQRDGRDTVAITIAVATPARRAA